MMADRTIVAIGQVDSEGFDEDILIERLEEAGLMNVAISVGPEEE
jgi:hypothetical protein